jgi:hypothetical protein
VLEELAKYDKGELVAAKSLQKEEQDLRQQQLFEKDRERQAEAELRVEKAKREIEEAKRQLASMCLDREAHYGCAAG